MEIIIQEILWGKAFAEIQDAQGNTHSVIVRSLNGKENNIINHIYAAALREGHSAGLCSEEELRQQYADRGVWTNADEEEIEKLTIGIRRLKCILPTFQYAKAKADATKARLRRAERDLNKLQTLKAELFVSSLEHRAAVVRSRKIALFTLENITEEPYWTDAEFEYFVDMTFINSVVAAYYEHFLLPTPQIREIARSSMWRYRWIATKNAADLFGCPASDWSEAQNSLVFWSGYYDRVFEHPDCPHELINNDEALDAWLERDNRNRRMDKKDVSKGRANIIRRKQKNRVGGMQETFIMVDGEDPDAVAEIQSMNDPATRARLRQERKIIKEKGQVTEWGLRKNQIIRESLRK
jgi:hypothetical protein